MCASADAEFEQYLAMHRLLIANFRGLSDEDAARLTEPELVEHARELGDREKVTDLMRRAGRATPPLLREEQRSGVLQRNADSVFQMTSWDEFRAGIAWTADERRDTTHLFRGQGKADWLLESEIERFGFAEKMLEFDPSADPQSIGSAMYRVARQNYLEPFKNSAYMTLGRVAAGIHEAEWWALARHHGLLTPVLDWSYSPYVAAFFAFSQFAERLSPGFSQGKNRAPPVAVGDDEWVAVWSLKMANHLFVTDEFEMVDVPAFENARMRSQQGALTLLRLPTVGGLSAYLSGRNRSDELAKYEIPARDVDIALADLRLMNIRPSTLFPDLGGAAWDANLGTRRVTEKNEVPARVGQGRITIDCPLVVRTEETLKVRVLVETGGSVPETEVEMRRAGVAATVTPPRQRVKDGQWAEFDLSVSQGVGPLVLSAHATGTAANSTAWLTVVSKSAQQS